MMNPFLWLSHTLIWLYIYILIASAVLSWLIAFNVVNSHNPLVRMHRDFLYADYGAGVAAHLATCCRADGRYRPFAVILIIGLMFLDQLIYWLYFSFFA